MDVESMQRFTEYSKAKDEMFAYTDTKLSPWFMVNADNKKKARLNCISHLLSMIPYQNLPVEEIELPERDDSKSYVRPPIEEMTFVPNKY